jgi:YegS/Rv2252/BmrU family lipid kinase
MNVEQRVVIFANPIAGKGKGRLLAERLSQRFEREGWQATLALDRPDEVDAEALAGITAAVSIGGDGTLRAVVERLTDSGKTEGPGVLVVPMGTANLMGRHLGVGLSVKGLEERAVKAIAARRIVKLDVGTIRNAKAKQMFLLMVGIGLDGEIVHALDRVRKGPIGFASYVLPAFGTLAGYQFHEIEVEVDGQVVWRMAPAVAFAGNVKEYGTGFPILPLARSDDELLDVCVMPARSVTDLIEHFVATFAGEHHLREGVVYVKGKRVVVRSKEPVAVQADGDPAGWTPVEVELLKTRVAFIVPER